MEDGLHSTINKKVAILLFRENCCLRAAGDTLRAREEFNGNKPGLRELCKEAYGKPEATISNQLNGKPLSPETINAICHNVEKYKVNLIRTDFSDEVDAYKFAEKFSLNREEAKKAIDQYLLCKPRPGSRHYLSKDLADKLFRAYKGVYSVYYPVSYQGRKLYIRAVLRVRYVLEVTKKAFLVRIKINVPKIEDADDYFEYVGTLTEGDNYLNWFFEEESHEVYQSNLDHLTIFTENKNKTLTGILSSLNQDTLPKMYSANVLIIKELDSTPTDIDKLVDFMRSKCQIYTKIEMIEGLSSSAIAYLSGAEVFLSKPFVDND